MQPQTAKRTLLRTGRNGTVGAGLPRDQRRSERHHRGINPLLQLKVVRCFLVALGFGPSRVDADQRPRIERVFANLRGTTVNSRAQPQLTARWAGLERVPQFAFIHVIPGQRNTYAKPSASHRKPVQFGAATGLPDPGDLLHPRRELDVLRRYFSAGVVGV